MRMWSLAVVVAGVLGCAAPPRPRASPPATPAPGPPGAPAPAPASAPSPPAARDLASVQWGEHSYQIDGQRYQLRRGSWEMHEYMEEWGGAHDTEVYRFESVTSGDLDGDGGAEAVVLLWHMYWGPGSAQQESLYLVTFGWKDGAPVQLDVTGAGNVRINAVEIGTGGELRVVHERAVPPFMTSRWRWEAGKLTPQL